MATLKEAERAREQSSEYLRGLGAHAVSVEEEPPAAKESSAPGRRRRAYAVVAWFEDDPPAALPAGLEVPAGSKTRVVPLRARRAERFRAE